MASGKGLDRRHFLRRAGGGLGGGLLLGGCDRVVDPILHPAEGVDREGAIDSHVHVWTPDLERYPLGRGFEVDRMKPPSFTVDELLAICRPHGVSRVVLVQPGFYRWDHAYLLDAMQSFPGTFGGVVLVDENGDDPSKEMRAFARQGVRGFRIRAKEDSAPDWLASNGMRTMWKTGADEGLYLCCLADEGALPAIYRMCEAFPTTPVVIDHCSRIGVTGTIEPASLDALLRLAEFASVQVKVSAFYALGQKAAPYTDLGPMIRALRDAFGAERLMWGSDCPYQVQKGHRYEDSIALIRDPERLDFLSDSDRDEILRGTAERVFFT